MAGFFRVSGDRVHLLVHLTPRASVDRIDGVERAADGRAHLKARVRVVPEKGLANAALEALIAKQLGLPKSGVAVTAGGTARLKTVTIKGDAEAIAARLAALG